MPLGWGSTPGDQTGQTPGDHVGQTPGDHTVRPQRAPEAPQCADRLLHTQEGANINKSLTTLGKVISALAEMVSWLRAPGTAPVG